MALCLRLLLCTAPVPVQTAILSNSDRLTVDRTVTLDRRWISGFSKPNYTTNKLRPAVSKTSSTSLSPAEQYAKKKKHAAKDGHKDSFIDFNPKELLFKQIRGLAELPTEHHNPKLVFHLIQEARLANYKLISLDLAEALTIIDSFSLDNQDALAEAPARVDDGQEPAAANEKSEPAAEPLNIDQLLTVCELIEESMASFAPREISISLVHLAAIKAREGDRFHLPLSFWPKCQGQLLSKKSLLTPALLSTLLYSAGQLFVVPTMPFFTAITPQLQKAVVKLSPPQLVDLVIGMALLDFPVYEDLQLALASRADSLLTFVRTSDLPSDRVEQFRAASTKFSLQ